MAEQVPRNSDGIWRANRYSHAQTLLAQHNMRDAYLKSLEATNDLGNLIREMGGTPTLRGKFDQRGGGLHHHFGPARGAGVPRPDPVDPS